LGVHAFAFAEFAGVEDDLRELQAAGAVGSVLGVGVEVGLAGKGVGDARAFQHLAQQREAVECDRIHAWIDAQAVQIAVAGANVGLTGRIPYEGRAQTREVAAYAEQRQVGAERGAHRVLQIHDQEERADHDIGVPGEEFFRADSAEIDDRQAVQGIRRDARSEAAVTEGVMAAAGGVVPARDFAAVERDVRRRVEMQRGVRGGGQGCLIRRELQRAAGKVDVAGHARVPGDDRCAGRHVERGGLRDRQDVSLHLLAVRVAQRVPAVDLHGVELRGGVARQHLVEPFVIEVGFGVAPFLLGQHALVEDDLGQALTAGTLRIVGRDHAAAHGERGGAAAGFVLVPNEGDEVVTAREPCVLVIDLLPVDPCAVGCRGGEIPEQGVVPRERRPVLSGGVVPFAGVDIHAALEAACQAVLGT